MAQWGEYYQNEDDPEQEEGEAPQGKVVLITTFANCKKINGKQKTSYKIAIAEWKYTGRDSLIFLVDASESMFQCMEEDEQSPFEMTLQCIRSVYTSKIISSEHDLLALVFYASREQNGTFKHVYVFHNLDTPGARRVLDLDNLQKKSQKGFDELIGSSAQFSLGEALWTCSNLFSDVKLRLSHKRVMLFTNEDNPHAGNGELARQARTKASDLRETGVVLDLIHLRKPGGFDVSLFFRDIVTSVEDEDLKLQVEPSSKLDDLLRRVRGKELKKRAQARLKLTLGSGVTLAVGVYIMVRSATRPSPIQLYRETNEPIRTKTRWFNGETGSLLLPSDTKKMQIYGKRQIVLEKEEVEELKKFDDPGLVLIGFKPLDKLKKHYHIRPAQFIYPEESQITGSSKLFTALLIKCLERQVFALCRYTPRRNTPPRFVALVPQSEELDEHKVQVTPPGFHLIFLPFADDIRKLDYPEKVQANQDQVDVMKKIVQKLRFPYRSDAFENPVIQKHFRNLEALALDLMEPEPIEDHTLPKVEMIDKRLGSLVDEFKEQVYPPDYNPEGKGTQQKRKTAEGSGATEKKQRMEISEAELRAHVTKGTLGKLTVPVLKDACKQLGLRSGTKKQELMDALTAYFDN
ncbi:XRCC6 protein, partial [Polypterus senegalus]|nr:XRCC6 protein [Polypterus senegalus]